MNWLSGLFGKRKREEELEEEVRSHLEMAARERVERGADAGDAERAARQEFGNVGLVKEVARDMRRWRWLEEFVEDARYGLRRMRKAPGFTAIAILTLALGIGANAAIFSLVNGILLAPLPYPNPDQLVSVTGTYPKGAFVAMRAQMRTMDVGSYVEGQELNLTGLGEPVRLKRNFSIRGIVLHPRRTRGVGTNILSGRGHPRSGQLRNFEPRALGERFGGDTNILGRSIELGGVSRHVIGVMPAEFRFPSTKTQVWIPLHNDSRNTVNFWAGDFMPGIGRVRPGSTIQQAQAEIRMFQSHVGSLFPWPMPASWNANVSVVPLQNGMVADVRARLLILLGAVGLILLIACSNVANLTLSRAATREKEISIRSALGAGRHRITRQLLTESVMQALFGGLLGLALAKEGLALLKTVLPADTPRLAEANMDWHVLAFTGALAMLTGVVFGLAPALHSAGGVLTESLNSGGRGTSLSVSQRLRSGLVVAEVAFAVLLVTAAGLMIRSFWAISHVNPGFGRSTS